MIERDEFERLYCLVHALKSELAYLRKDLVEAGALKELLPAKREADLHATLDELQRSLEASGATKAEAGARIELMRAAYDAVYAPFRRLEP